MKKFERYVCLLLSACPLMIGQPAPDAAASPSLAAASYVLGPEDQVKIWALGVEELADKPSRIDPSGDIDLPLIGKVHAGGLTLEQLKAELVQRFSKEILKPQVTIEIVDFGSQPVSVIGAVNHPGVHQLRGHKTLMEMLSAADGLRPDAGPRILISRQVQYGPVPLHGSRPDVTGQYSVAEINVRDLLTGAKPADNVAILPHDVITVPSAQSVYVIGEVRKPGEVALKDNGGMSVLQAFATAEGFGPAPAPQDSKIYRLVEGSSERREIPVDLTKIQSGKAEDVAMRPNDILYVPASGPKKMATRALEAAIQAATGIAIWRRP